MAADPVIAAATNFMIAMRTLATNARSTSVLLSEEPAMGRQSIGWASTLLFIGRQ
jgi:hypothetical protein